ncbi:helix-turn-helix domain-containing protein [Deinococcus sp.]|uniref:winged helix-turn-helix transcriptional regulator n=1 Tax=Deinococcus sp. TaxID=47478 RepID=UPI0025EE50FD|nr:helix-turn-helix domain-containing protein [Deinococcus sp.]
MKNQPQGGTFSTETHIPVPEDTLSAADCRGLADALSSVGDKWTILVVGALAGGELRYNEIQRRVNGISQRMLTLTLKRLELDGIVTRTLFPSVPPRVDYELTDLGQTLRAALVPLHLWAAQNRGTMAKHRARVRSERE